MGVWLLALHICIVQGEPCGRHHVPQTAPPGGPPETRQFHRDGGIRHRCGLNAPGLQNRFKAVPVLGQALAEWAVGRQMGYGSGRKNKKESYFSVTWSIIVLLQMKLV